MYYYILKFCISISRINEKFIHNFSADRQHMDQPVTESNENAT